MKTSIFIHIYVYIQGKLDNAQRTKLLTKVICKLKKLYKTYSKKNQLLFK